MLTFASDYTTGCCPEILDRLIATNLEPQTGYGTDQYCASAAEKIKSACNAPEAQIEFIAGGTQTNQVVISSMLQRYEGVVAARTGHISCHEAGAIEYTGHKVFELPQVMGKIRAKDLSDLVENFYGDDNHDHMVFPGMVYISHPTEYGTLYTLSELTAISEVCRKHNMPLFLDGARLGYGLMSYSTDVTLQDIARLCDVFYIGGTKVGALCGEAVVFTHGNMPKHFLTMKKQNGALLAKGRLLGVQFDTLFTDDLYFKIAKHAIDMAERLKGILSDASFPFLLESPTNQQFVVLDNTTMERLKKDVGFGFWETVDEDHTAVRFATSWSTTEKELDKLQELLK
ncbi:MAG: aminotransferase class V-fold PLP-dependent enzyme [Spirochaetales bacterium]|nr:aminotransferase class V-fold PLP-dependent enzyme [Spirochaetales bacterium]